jgi:predicted outer membrane repeat protein
MRFYKFSGHSLFFYLLIVLMSGTCNSEVIHIPGDYPTIQEGINASAAGDTVLVADGTWSGTGNRDLNYGGKSISVMSENGADTCIIDCEGSEPDNHRGVSFSSGETADAVFEGITVRNGHVSQTGNTDGGAIYISGANPTIRNCQFIDNQAVWDGGAIYCFSSYSIISGCLFGIRHCFF